MTKTKVDLGLVQETALITLWARATELKQAAPIIVDPKSVEILEALDYDFSKFTHAKDSQTGNCLRGAAIDNWVLRYLVEHPQGPVVELGAGLNTRFERVDNSIVRWFDLDLPDIMAVRKQFFQESDRRQFITASAFETNWCERVKAPGSNPSLFVAEGVLMYFNEAQVKQLFANLAEYFPGSLFAFDSYSPWLLRNLKRFASLQFVSAKFDWGISDIYKIQDWDSRYKVVEISKITDSPAQYLKRYSLLKRLLFSYVPLLRDSSRLALVQLG